MVEEVEVGCCAAGADDARLVMHLPERHVRLDSLLLDVIEAEAKDMGFAGIHPDDGTTVRHDGSWSAGFLLRLQPARSAPLIWINPCGGRNDAAPCRGLRPDRRPGVG